MPPFGYQRTFGTPLMETIHRVPRPVIASGPASAASLSVRATSRWRRTTHASARRRSPIPRGALDDLWSSSSIALLFGLCKQTSAVAAARSHRGRRLGELSLAGRMIAKGFRPSRTLERASHPLDLSSPVASAWT
jgi:hypothetical protein